MLTMAKKNYPLAGVDREKVKKRRTKEEEREKKKWEEYRGVRRASRKDEKCKGGL